MCQSLLFGQGDTTFLKPYTSDINDFKLNGSEERISITSQTPIFVKDAPGTVSIITEDEIQSMGARDLTDVLRTIPGFEFSCDVQGVVGIGVRGNSANESVLLLIDGIEMNELLFGSNQFGNHYPIDQIRRIEVIRGPGTVVYGGFGVFAVISVITKASEWFNGFRVGQTVGETKNGMARRNFSSSIGAVWPNTKFSLVASLAEANRSDRNYTDLNGRSYNMLTNSSLSNKFLNFNFKQGNFFLKGIWDSYQTTNRDNQTAISSRAYPLNFQNFNLEGRYEWKPKENVNVQPFVNYRRQVPWETVGDIDSVDLDKVIPFRVIATRLTGGIKVNWTLGKNLNFLILSTVLRDQAQDLLNPDSTSQSGIFYCKSISSQASWKTKFANFTIGLRLDEHSYYRPIFSPRISINKSLKNWYGKLSFNRSFRTPALSNIALSIEDKLQPQLTNSYEAEVGFKVSNLASWSLNIFQTQIRDGIVYSLLSDGFTEGYSNAAEMGTKGFETEGKIHFNKFVLQGSYSFYTTQGLPTYSAFEVQGTNLNLAYPAHKTCLIGRYEISPNLKLTNTIIWLSDRYGFNGNFDLPDNINYGNVLQWNVFFQAKDVYLKGLSIGGGVNDILNSNYSFIQSYNSGHMPLPAMSREYVIKLVYGLNLTKL